MESEITYIQKELLASIETKQRILADKRLLEKILQVAQVCIQSLQAGNRIFLAGNGGSAADAQHIATEFVSRFMYNRPGLSAIALTTDTSILTAISNDYGYERLFARQLETHARKGDVFIGITTSGNSPNILHAIECCHNLGVTSIGLAGSTGKIQSICDYLIAVPSNITPRIQEAHITIGHIICGLVETTLFPIAV